MRLLSRLVLSAALLVFSGCGGAGAGVATGVQMGSPSDRGAASVSGSVVLAFGGTATSGAVRRTAFLSPSARSVSIAVSGVAQPVVADVSATSPICTGSATARTCAIALSAPAGTQTFSVTIYDGANATGNTLGSGTATQAIVAGSPFSVSILATGITANVTLSAAAGATFTRGVAGTANLTVTALDAGGNAITGAYASPVTVAVADTTGAFTVSPGSVSVSGMPVTITYNGASNVTLTTIRVQATGAQPQIYALCDIFCFTPGGSVTIPFATLIDTNGPITWLVTDLPAGVTGTYASPTTVSGAANTLTVSGTTATATGVYTITRQLADSNSAGNPLTNLRDPIPLAVTSSPVLVGGADGCTGFCVAQGSSLQYAWTNAGTREPMRWFAANVPSGATATFTPPITTALPNATVETIATSAATPAAAYVTGAFIIDGLNITSGTSYIIVNVVSPQMMSGSRVPAGVIPMRCCGP